MISRKSTSLLAKAFVDHFTSMPPSIERLSSVAKVLNWKSLAEFIYDNEFEPPVVFQFQLYNAQSAHLVELYIKTLHLTNDQKGIRHFAEKYLSIKPRNTGLLGHPLNALMLSIVSLKDQLIRSLELDGYVFKNDRLYKVENAVVDQEKEAGFLESLLSGLSLKDMHTIVHHLGLANQHYIEGRWDDSISNSRKVLEGLLQQIASRISIEKLGVQLDQKVHDKPIDVRKFLVTHGLFTDKQMIGVGGFYGLLSDTGGHPYIAKNEEARLMLNGVLTMSQFIAIRYQGFGSKKAKVNA